MRLLPIVVSICLLPGCDANDPAGQVNEVVANGVDPAVKRPTGPRLGEVELSRPLRASDAAASWTLDVAPGRILFKDRANAAGTDFYPIAPVIARERAVWTTQTPEGEAVTITLTQAICESGRRGTGSPLSAEVTIGVRRLKGCAAPLPQGATASASSVKK